MKYKFGNTMMTRMECLIFKFNTKSTTPFVEANLKTRWPTCWMAEVKKREKCIIYREDTKKTAAATSVATWRLRRILQHATPVNRCSTTDTDSHMLLSWSATSTVSLLQVKQQSQASRDNQTLGRFLHPPPTSPSL